MLGYESKAVNGQLVNVAPLQAYNPLTFGQAYTGPGMWPRQGVYNVPPVMPSAASQGSMAPSSYGAIYPLPTSVNEKGSPWSVKKSPLWWGLGFLIVGILMLQHIHYK